MLIQLNFEIGIKIPAGTSIDIHPYVLHRDPEYWTDPLEFKPERFLEPTHNPWAYVPFGCGPRMCIAERFALIVLRICIAKLFSRFEFSLSPEFKLDYFTGNISLKPKSVEVFIRTRN